MQYTGEGNVASRLQVILGDVYVQIGYVNYRSAMIFPEMLSVFLDDVIKSMKTYLESWMKKTSKKNIHAYLHVG